MSARNTADLTGLLVAWGEGDETALERLIPLVYDELHRIAHRYMKGEIERGALQTTALVNEAYLRLVDSRRVKWQNRTHFFAVSAQLMRRILVDFARSRDYQKRGGKIVHTQLDEALTVANEPAADLVALDDALTELAAMDLRKSQVVEMRFFGGMSVDETAEALRVSPETVMRDWKLARVWLLRTLRRQEQDAS